MESPPSSPWSPPHQVHGVPPIKSMESPPSSLWSPPPHHRMARICSFKKLRKGRSCAKVSRSSDINASNGGGVQVEKRGPLRKSRSHPGWFKVPESWFFFMAYETDPATNHRGLKSSHSRLEAGFFVPTTEVWGFPFLWVLGASFLFQKRKKKQPEPQR